MGAGQELQGKDISMGSNMHTLLTDPEGTYSFRAATSHCLLHSQMLRGLVKAPSGGCTHGGFPPGTKLGLRLKWDQGCRAHEIFLTPILSPLFPLWLLTVCHIWQQAPPHPKTYTI